MRMLTGFTSRLYEWQRRLIELLLGVPLQILHKRTNLHKTSDFNYHHMVYAI